MPDESAQYAYVKHRFVKEDRARISIKERGFRFGDGVFETIRVTHGAPYQWEFHLDRLSKGLLALHIKTRLGPLLTKARELIQRNGVKEGILRISVSRGIGSQGYLPVMEKSDPLIVMETMPLPELPKEPVTLWMSSIRKPSPESLPIEYKLMQGLNSTLARMQAVDHHCFDAVQLSNTGQLAETSSASLFWLRDYVLYTPATSCGALDGSVRQAIMRISPYKVTAGNYPPSEMEKADEVFITNAAWGILPVAGLMPNDWHWQPGPVIHRLQELLVEDQANYAETHYH